MSQQEKKIPGEAYSKHIHARFWLTDGQNSYLGIGRIELLQKIDELGSISQAAKSMSMSYKKAWKLIDELNSMFDEPLIIKAIGGKDGGGSQLTYRGREVVKDFKAVEQELQLFLVKWSKKVLR